RLLASFPGLVPSGRFADLDGVIAGLERNFWPARGAGFTFQMCVAFLAARGVERAAGKFRVDVAGMAVGLDFEIGGRRNAKSNRGAFVADRDVFFGRIGIANFD